MAAGDDLPRGSDLPRGDGRPPQAGGPSRRSTEPAASSGPAGPAVPEAGPGGASSEIELDGRFTTEKLGAVLHQVCRAAGLDPADAQLLRFTNNAVFRLRAQPVVVRIVASRALRHRVAKVAAVARWLADHDVPAVRLLPGFEEPLRAGPHVATLWQDVPETGDRPTGADLARLLHRIHELPRPPDELPGWDPLDDVRARLADAEELEAGDRAFLEQRCAAVQAAMREVRYELRPALVHGDAHLGNVIAGPDGPVLCDFDSASYGPPEWDLTPLAVGPLRFGHPPHLHRELADAYGFDVTRWAGFPVLREIRELKLTTSVLPILRSNPAVREQFALRLRTFRDGTDELWQPYT